MNLKMSAGNNRQIVEEDTSKRIYEESEENYHFLANNTNKLQRI